jgi:hypothetical protein
MISPFWYGLTKISYNGPREDFIMRNKNILDMSNFPELADEFPIVEFCARAPKMYYMVSESVIFVVRNRKVMWKSWRGKLIMRKIIREYSQRHSERLRRLDMQLNVQKDNNLKLNLESSTKSIPKHGDFSWEPCGQYEYRWRGIEDQMKQNFKNNKPCQKPDFYLSEISQKLSEPWYSGFIYK